MKLIDGMSPAVSVPISNSVRTDELTQGMWGFAGKLFLHPRHPPLPPVPPPLLLCHALDLHFQDHMVVREYQEKLLVP